MKNKALAPALFLMLLITAHPSAAERILVETQRIEADIPKEFAGFGWDIDIDGDRLVVAQGSYAEVRIFERNTDDKWVEVATLAIEDPDGVEFFGSAVAIDGDRVMVGAQGDFFASVTGAVYVFERQGDGSWVQQQVLTASNAGLRDRFGSDIDLDGTTAVVGAFGEDGASVFDPGNRVFESGAAYVFELENGSWVERTYLKASNPDSDDNFGIGVAVSGDTVAVVAAGEDSDGSSQNDNSATSSGAVYVFERFPSGWGQVAYLKAGTVEAFSRPGSVSISDGQILAGFRGKDIAYLFEKEAQGGWQVVSALNPPRDPADVFDFGFSVDIDGGTAVVSGYNRSTPPELAAQAFVYQREPGGSWRYRQTLTGSDNEEDDQFGREVAVSGPAIFVSASWSDTDRQSPQLFTDDNDAGAVYYFVLSFFTDGFENQPSSRVDEQRPRATSRRRAGAQ